MDLTDDTRKRIAYSEVEGIKLRYTITQETNKPAEIVNIDILKNELRIGSGSVERNGKFFISLDKGDITSSTTQIALTSQMITDGHSFFNDNE